MIFGDNLDHMRRSLEGTIVLRDDLEPVYIERVFDRKYLGVHSLGNMNEGSKKIKVGEINFDILPKPGLINSRGKLGLRKRRTSRQYRFGLNSNNCPDFLSRTDITGRPFYNCLINNYPDLDEALDLLKRDFLKEVAFHKDYALFNENSDKFVSLYRTISNRFQRVGNVNSDNSEITLDSDFTYLKEEIDMEILT